MAPFLILRTTASLAGIVAWSVQRGRDLLSESLMVTELGQIPFNILMLKEIPVWKA